MLLCETFFCMDALKLVKIPHCSLCYNNKENTTGGQIAIYVNDNVDWKEQLDHDVCEEGFLESKFSEVVINTSEKEFLEILHRK